MLVRRANDSAQRRLAPKADSRNRTACAVPLTMPCLKRHGASRPVSSIELIAETGPCCIWPLRYVPDGIATLSKSMFGGTASSVLSFGAGLPTTPQPPTAGLPFPNENPWNSQSQSRHESVTQPIPVNVSRNTTEPKLLVQSAVGGSFQIAINRKLRMASSPMDHHDSGAASTWNDGNSDLSVSRIWA